MERKRVGLDRLSRRQMLQFVLSIPPILLGLDDIHGHGAPAFARSTTHSSSLPTIDELHQDRFLTSTALGRRAAALYELGDLAATEKNVREALAVACASDQIKRYPVASRVLSSLARDRVDRSEVFRMLDHLVVNDQYNKGDDDNILLWCRAQAMINMAQHSLDHSDLLRQASELLDHVELTAPNTLRRHLIIKMEQARAYVGLREYEYAVDCAIEAFGLMQQIKSTLYVSQLAKVYRTVVSSLSSPQVTRLGLLLFQVGELYEI